MARLGSATYHPWVRTQLYNLNLNARENEKCSLPMCPGKGNGISKHSSLKHPLYLLEFSQETDGMPSYDFKFNEGTIYRHMDAVKGIYNGL